MNDRWYNRIIRDSRYNDRCRNRFIDPEIPFIDSDTFYNNFFSDDEVIFYNNISNLSEKIQKYAKDDVLRKKIAKKGKAKYMRFFNSTIVADYIITKTFNKRSNKNFLWDK